MLFSWRLLHNTEKSGDCDPVHTHPNSERILKQLRPAAAGARATEGAMPKVDRWYNGVPRVELNQRARDARLRLERLKRLLVPRTVMTGFWLRRVVCFFSFDQYESPQGHQARGPLNNQRPSRMPTILKAQHLGEVVP
jgi:hypothetical protein